MRRGRWCRTRNGRTWSRWSRRVGPRVRRSRRICGARSRPSIWRHENGAKWRAIPAELGPWSRAAQTFIRWAHLGVWERLLLLAQEGGVQLGMTFLDGTSIRAHHKAAGAEKRGPPAKSAMSVKRWAVRVAAMGPRRA